MTFRTDINGLRSLAVIAVTLFHFNETLLPGGFIGVDIFFVISGFLMTKIIINGLSNHTFSLKVFYTARAVRIIPPLAALCLCLLIFGWFFLTPMDYRQVGNDVLNSMLFVSNFIYAKEKGYFDTSSSEEWLLHTWSLSTEWQFYLIYPLILLGIYKLLGQHKTKAFILAATIVSFVICIIWSNIAPTASYFLLPTRAWEMLIGGVAFLYPLSNKKNHPVLSWFGIAIIFTSAIFINEVHLWPSYLTLLPILGTYLVIISNQKNAFLDNKPMQYIGSWSYSIYLWHWVIVTVGLYLSIPNWIFIGLPLSVLLGYLSYRFIETRKQKTFITNPVFLIIITGGLGGFIHKTNGLLPHYSNDIQRIYNDNKSVSIHCEESDILGCKFINKNNVTNDGYADYILLGDSHANSQIHTVLESIPKDKSLIYIGSSACLFSPNLGSNLRDITSCNNAINIAYESILPKNIGSTVIFIQRTNIYFQGYNDNEGEDTKKDIRYNPSSSLISSEDVYTNTLCTLAENYNVIVTKPTPEQTVNVPHYQIKSLLLNINNDISISLEHYKKRNEHNGSLFKKLDNCGVNILNPEPYLCNETNCPIINNDTSVYLDDDHLSIFGADLLLPMFKDAFKN